MSILYRVELTIDSSNLLIVAILGGISRCRLYRRLFWLVISSNLSLFTCVLELFLVSLLAYGVSHYLKKKNWFFFTAYRSLLRKWILSPSGKALRWLAALALPRRSIAAASFPIFNLKSLFFLSTPALGPSRSLPRCCATVHRPKTFRHMLYFSVFHKEIVAGSARVLANLRQ